MDYSIQEVLKPILKELEAKLYDFSGTTYILETIMSSPLRTRDFFYRIVNFENDKILSANHGGGFACQHQASGENSQPIEVYTNNLIHILSVFSPDEYGQLNAYYYTPEELLVCIFTNRACVFNQHGQMIDEVKLFTLENNEFFEFACFQEYGFFVVTNHGNIYYVDSYRTFNCEKFANFDISLFDSISSNGSSALPGETREYIDGEEKGYGPMLWISATKGKKNFLICAQKDNIQILDFPVRVMNLFYSPDYSKVAVVSSDQLLIFNKNFTENISCFNIPDIGLKRIGWCSNTAILVAGNSNLTMINFEGKILNIPICGDFTTIAEVDGARIVTSSEVYYLRIINGTSLDLVRRNKSNPALKLIFDSSSKLSAAQEDPIDAIPELGSALSGCLDAISFFRNTQISHLLLNLVVRYKTNVAEFDFQRFSNLVMQKRITEQLVNTPTFLPLTSEQLTALGNEHLLMRLCNRYQHYVSYRIADYINFSYEPLYNNWAHSLIFSNAPQSEIIYALKESGHSFDYVQLATAACKRQGDLQSNIQFATKLLDLNSVKARSLPLLIMWRAWNKAIQAAVESNDTSLLAYTLKVIQEEINELKIKESNTNSSAQSSSSSAFKSSSYNLFKNLVNLKPLTGTENETSESLQKKINQTLLESPIALETWILLNPDDPNITDLLSKSGNKKGAVNREFRRAIEPGLDNQGVPSQLNDVKKKASKLSDSFGANSAGRAIDMINACKDLKIPICNTPIEALDAVLAKNNGKISNSVQKKLNVSDEEILVRRVELGFTKYMNGEGEQLLKNALKEFKPDQLINFGNELFRQQRFDIAQAIMNNTNNSEVRRAMQEFDQKYQLPL